jgi:hypothetical protein
MLRCPEPKVWYAMVTPSVVRVYWTRGASTARDWHAAEAVMSSENVEWGDSLLIAVDGPARCGQSMIAW